MEKKARAREGVEREWRENGVDDARVLRIAMLYCYMHGVTAANGRERESTCARASFFDIRNAFFYTGYIDLIILLYL